jgi:sulfur-oxidizing protein SoxX
VVTVKPREGPTFGARHIFCGCSFLAALTLATHAFSQTAPLDGRALSIAERKGNCIACHQTPTGASQKSVVSIGIPLEAIRQKYPNPADRAKLRDAIWDMSKLKPDTIMPPYGKHHILTDAEIDAIVNYLETL